MLFLFFNKWGKLKGHTVAGCGCTACETSLELVHNPQVQQQLYRPAPLALSFLPTRRIFGIVKMPPVWWCPLLVRAFPPPLVKLMLTVSPVPPVSPGNFAQIPVSIRLLFLELLVGLITQELTVQIASPLAVPKKPLRSFEFIDKFAQPPVTYFYGFGFTSAYPCSCWGWNCCQTSQVCMFPSLYHPS